MNNDLKPIITQTNIVGKKWGHEEHIINLPEYCLKKLVFKKGCKFSNHLHINKLETWIVTRGSFILTYINPLDASKHDIFLEAVNIKDVITIPRFLPHQLEALEDSEIWEVSTTDSAGDNFRIEPGDSQK